MSDGMFRRNKAGELILPPDYDQDYHGPMLDRWLSAEQCGTPESAPIHDSYEAKLAGVKRSLWCMAAEREDYSVGSYRDVVDEVERIASAVADSYRRVRNANAPIGPANMDMAICGVTKKAARGIVAGWLDEIRSKVTR